MTEREAIATAVIWLREAAKLPNAQPCRPQIEEVARQLAGMLGRPDDTGVLLLVAEPCGEWQGADSGDPMEGIWRTDYREVAG